MLPLVVSSPRTVSTSPGASPSTAARRWRAAAMPNAWMSRVIAVSGGWTTWLMRESSHPTIETSSGTEKPICWATPRPVTASRSLSKTIAVGASGCYAGGVVSDRWGRTTLTMAAMALSGLCALLIGFTFGGPPLLTLTVALVWGVSVIADSAQFSASVTELSQPAYMGTALTLQTSLGFALTMLTIWGLPLLAQHGRRWDSADRETSALYQRTVTGSHESFDHDSRAVPTERPAVRFEATLQQVLVLPRQPPGRA